jgi:chromosomal replication initiator protein
VVDQLTDIPLPGRKLAPQLADTANGHALVSPVFIAGPENRLVAATFRRLITAAGATPAALCNAAARPVPSVLCLFGPSGAGKTHLVHGLVRHWQQQCGEETAEYMTAADFRRQFLAAIRSDGIVEFRRCLRGRQLLAIDDLHQLPADEHLSQELRYTLDACEERGGIVFITASRPPATLGNMPPDVRSRLAAGLMLQLAAPGAAARLRIVRQTSAALGRSISDEAAQRLATAVKGTASDLIGALFELCSMPRGNDATDAVEADQVLADRMANRPTLREITAVVARYTGVPQKQLKSGSRKQSTVFARAIVVYLARELAAASYHEIGRALGGRDHTTTMHNYRNIDADRLRNSATQEALDELRRILLSR